MSTTPVAPKVSFWHKFGDAVLHVVDFLAGKAVPIAQAAGAVVSIADPALAPEISLAENLLSKIALQAQVTQAAFAAVGQGSNGTAKMQAVLAAIEPELNTWVQNSFPGAAKVSQAASQGLVQAVYNLINEIDPNLALATPTSVAVASAITSALATPKPISATNATATVSVQ